MWETLTLKEKYDFDAIEEVRNDFKDPEERTQWLNIPVDNISMWKKTYYNRNNWNVVVWDKWKSIEMIPTDIGIKNLVADESRTWTWSNVYATVFWNEFNFSGINTTENKSTIENDWNKIKILEDWLYEVWFNFGIELIWHVEWIEVWVTSNVVWKNVFHKEYWSMTWIDISATWTCSGSCWEWSCSGTCSTFTTIYLDDMSFTRRFIWNSRKRYFEFNKWDILEFIVMALYEPSFTWTFKLLKDYTDWYVRYLKPKI